MPQNAPGWRGPIGWREDARPDHRPRRAKSALFGQPVQQRAQAANHHSLFFGLPPRTGWQSPPDSCATPLCRCPKRPGDGASAVDHQEDLAVKRPSGRQSASGKPRLADQITPQLTQMRIGIEQQAAHRALRPAAPTAARSKRHVAGEIGNAKPTAQVCPRAGHQPPRPAAPPSATVLAWVSAIAAASNADCRQNVKAPFGPGINQPPYRRTRSYQAKGLGPAAIFMPLPA